MKLFLFLFIPFLLLAQNPTQIDNKLCVLDWELGTTVSGAGVSEWLDQTSNNLDFIQGTDADRPNLGVSSIEFDKSNSEWLDDLDNDLWSFTDGAGNDEPFSIVVYVKIIDDTLAPILTKFNTDPNSEWRMELDGSGKFHLLLHGGGDGAVYIGLEKNALMTSYENQWITLACTYDGLEGNASSFALYVDGVQVTDTTFVSAGSYTGMSNGASPTRLNTRVSAPQYSDIEMTDLIVTTDVLTPTEIAQLDIYFRQGSFPADYDITTYYVDNSATGNGSDDNTGFSIVDPLASFDSLNTTGITLEPSDIVYLRTGDIWREQLTVPSSGTSGNPITFTPYDSATGLTGTVALALGDSAKISGADVVTTWTIVNNALTSDGNTLALWNFDEDLTDDSGNSRTLTDNATITYSNTNAAFDYYAIFDGSDDLSYSDSEGGDENAFDFDTTTSFTVEAFIKTSDSSTEWIFGKGATTRWELYKQAGSPVVAKAVGYDGSEVASITGTTAIDDGVWHHLALRVDWAAEVDSAITLWVDGSKEGATVALAPWVAMDNASDFTIGSKDAGSDYFNGQIEQVRISDVARTSFPAGAGSPNVWSAELAGDVATNIVIFDGTVGTEVANQAAVNSTNEWWDDTGESPDVVYVYSVSDPDNLSSPGMEAGQRTSAITATSKEYITIDGITAQAGNISTNGAIFFSFANGDDGITIKNCTVENTAGEGILFYSATAVTLTNVLVDSNTIDDTGRMGIQIFLGNATSGNENIISNNVITGFAIEGITIRSNYAIVEYNEVHTGGSLDQIGGGIHVYSDSLAEVSGDNNIIRYNYVHDITGHLYDGYGISADQWCDDNQIYYNKINDTDGPGIYLYDSNGCRIYNNTIDNPCIDTAGDGEERGGIRLTSSVDDLCDSNIVKNNICFVSSSGAYAVYVDSETYDNTLEITNNLWYRVSGNWYFWNAGGGNSLATWNALTGIGTDLNSDPLFTDAASNDFTLQSGSPAIDAGTDVGLTQDYLGNGLFGSAWDIGAYESQIPIGYQKRYKRFTDYWRYRRY